MRRAAGVLCLLLAGGTPPATAQSEFGGLPEGEGRLETFQNCIRCHSMAIIRQQRLSRERWDQILTWMVDVQGMHEMPPEVRARVLDYLAEKFSPEVPR
jgi:hypothetical protein